RREKRPPDHPGGRFCVVGSGEADVRGLRSLLALRDLELNALALFEAAVARRVDGRGVREDVLSAVVGGDEAETLFGIEPLHGSSGHETAFFMVHVLPNRTRQPNLVHDGGGDGSTFPRFHRIEIIRHFRGGCAASHAAPRIPAVMRSFARTIGVAIRSRGRNSAWCFDTPPPTMNSSGEKRNSTLL